MNETIDEKTGEVLPNGNPRPFYAGGKNVARKVTHPKTKDALAKQEFKQESDINFLMERYKATGLIPQQVGNVQAHFANFENVDDYYTACSKAASAQMAFDTLPSKLRKMFDNDPAKLVAFVSDDKNKLAAAKMGLLTPEASAKAYKTALDKKEADEAEIVKKANAKTAQKASQKQVPTDT